MAGAIHRHPRREILNRAMTVDHEMRLMAEEEAAELADLRTIDDHLFGDEDGEYNDGQELRELPRPRWRFTDLDRLELEAVIRDDLERFNDELFDAFGHPTEAELDAYERTVTDE